jgi:hypothetical protein
MEAPQMLATSDTMTLDCHGSHGASWEQSTEHGIAECTSLLTMPAVTPLCAATHFFSFSHLHDDAKEDWEA